MKKVAKSSVMRERREEDSSQVLLVNIPDLELVVCDLGSRNTGKRFLVII